jgi:hypothetical protein
MMQLDALIAAENDGAPIAAWVFHDRLPSPY